MKTILIVEDDPFIVDVYATKFKEEDYQVEVARDCEVALEKIKNNYPDLLVLDINFGQKKSGGEFLKMIRSDERTKNLKVIVLSNYTVEQIIEKYQTDIFSLGVIKHFLKAQTPVQGLVDAIKEILK